MIHQRRAKGHSGVAVTFTVYMKLISSSLLPCLEALLKKTCKVYHAVGDADLLILQKAVESSTLVDTLLVGYDTDLLVLLCYHSSLNYKVFFFTQILRKIPKSHKFGISSL